MTITVLITMTFGPDEPKLHFFFLFEKTILFSTVDLLCEFVNACESVNINRNP